METCDLMGVFIVRLNKDIITFLGQGYSTSKGDQCNL